MDFPLTEEQQMPADSVARFVLFADNGWLAAGVPEKMGGPGAETLRAGPAVPA
jgi:hypothetical protein